MKKGFSLVELSIVLVILGLLVGGILAGQALIQASELRSFSTQLTNYQTATQTFRDKYFAVPGDMNNATAFWGAETTCPSTDRTPKTLTCNGNGNGTIEWTNEQFTFWQHLANAGLIEGSFWGVAGPANSYDHVCGSNTPPWKFRQACARAVSGGNMPATDSAWFPGDYGKNMLTIGTQVAGTWPTGSLFKPEDMWNIDSKIDDGKPGFGRIISAENYTQCHNAPYVSGQADPAVADYRLTNPNVNCLFIYKQLTL